MALPLLFFFLIMGGVWLRCAVCIISCIGIFEFERAVSGKFKPIHLWGLLTEVLYIAFMDRINSDVIMFYMMISIMLLLSAIVIMHKSTQIKDAMASVFGFLYVGLLLGNVFAIRNESLYMIWLPFICAFGSDTGAYFTGRTFGKHKLTPVLSPKKTVEGAIGGVLSAAILSTLFCVLSFHFKPVVPSALIFFAIGAFGSVLAQLGDLAASSVKRTTGIKDYGNIMPGHGGVLDRFDSVLFTLPYIYMIIKFTGIK